MTRVGLLLLCISICFAFDLSEFSAQFKAHGVHSQERYEGHVMISKTPSGFEIHAASTDKDTMFLYSNQRLIHISGSTASCVPGFSIPPIHHGLSALKDSIELRPSEIKAEFAEECKGRKILKTTFVGESYLICLGSTITVRGSEFVAELTPVPKQQLVSLHKMVSLHQPNIAGCDESTRISLSNSLKGDESNDQWWRPTPSIEKRQANKFDCVWIHGSGQKIDGPATSSFTDYWGNVSAFTPQCRSHKFIHMDTRHLGWESLYNQQKICKLATSNHNNGTELRNTMIFTHSMGTLLFAGALYNKVCTIGNTSRWYGSQGPIDGSNLITFLADICSNTTVRATLANLLGLCDADEPLEAYTSMLPSNPNLAKAAVAIRSYLSGMMCGSSAFGLNTRFSIALAFLQTYGNLEKPNDGMVAFLACSMHTQSRFTNSASSNYYAGAFNHADGTCRNGNGWWGDDRKPCNYYGKAG